MTSWPVFAEYYIIINATQSIFELMEDPVRRGGVQFDSGIHTEHQKILMDLDHLHPYDTAREKVVIASNIDSVIQDPPGWMCRQGRMSGLLPGKAHQPPYALLDRHQSIWTDTRRGLHAT